MKVSLLVGVSVCAAAVAAADPVPDPPDARAAAKCARGAELAARGDLPRAALLLDGCEDSADDAIARAAHDVSKKLRASELSELSIVSRPAGAVIETDALPGEQIVAPATVWAKGGTYRIHATRGDGGDGSATIDQTVTLASHSRGSIVLAFPAAPAGGGHAKDGTVSFGEEGDVGERTEGPPPDQKHKSIMPQRYIDGGTIGGPQLDDPLANAVEPVPQLAAWRVGVRAGTGVFEGARIGASIAAAVRVRAPWEAAAAAQPFALDARIDYAAHGIGALGAELGASKILAAPDAAWLSLQLAARVEARFADMTSTRAAFGATAALELALRRLPVALDARYEQLTGGARAALVEVGGDFGR